MPSSCGYAWPTDVDLIIRTEARNAGAPLDVVYALIAVESGFNPNARNYNPPIEDSVGLLQLNRLGGQGTGYTVEQLVDPTFNLRVGLPPIASAHAQANARGFAGYEYIWQVAASSGHPGLVPSNDPRIRRIFQVWACFLSGVGEFGPTGVPTATPTPGPGQQLPQAIAALFAPGMPVPPASVLSAHAGSNPMPILMAIARGTAKRFIGSLGPRTLVRRQIRALTPGALRQRAISAVDPRAQLARAFRLPYPFAMDRLPRRHRHPRF